MSEFCQSCGMPFDEDHSGLRAVEPGGRDSVYCEYCYRDGAFTDPDATVEQMVEVGVPHLAHKIGEEAARAQLSAFLPTLERWRKGI